MIFSASNPFSTINTANIVLFSFIELFSALFAGTFTDVFSTIERLEFDVLPVELLSTAIQGVVPLTTISKTTEIANIFKRILSRIFIPLFFFKMPLLVFGLTPL